MLHVGARIPGPARRVRESVGEAGCNITHIGHSDQARSERRAGGCPRPSRRAEPPSGGSRTTFGWERGRPGSVTGCVVGWYRLRYRGDVPPASGGSSRRGRRRATAGMRRVARRRSAGTGRPRGLGNVGLPRPDGPTDLREPEELGLRSAERSFAAPSGPPYTWQPSPRLPAGPVLAEGRSSTW